MYDRELEWDLAYLKMQIEDQAFQNRKFAWMLVMSVGGEIRIPKSVVRDVEDPGELVVYTDEETGDVVYCASLFSPDGNGLKDPRA